MDKLKELRQRSTKRGVDKFLEFCTINDLHFRDKTDLIDAANYNYGSYRPAMDNNRKTAFDQVLELFRLPVILGNMGTDQYIPDIFGLSVYDVMKMDLATFEAFRGKVTDIRRKDQALKKPAGDTEEEKLLRGLTK